MGFAKYTLVGTKIIKDGHTMFPEDIVRDLNRKSALEEKILQSASLNQHTTAVAMPLKRQAYRETLQEMFFNKFIIVWP